MADTAITSRETRARVVRHVFEYYSASALTTGTAKKEWIVPFACKIIDIIVDSETASVGGAADDLIDVNVNGTSIFVDTHTNQPTLTKTNTGFWATTLIPTDTVNLAAGDILSIDVDQVDTTGSARVKVAISVAVR